MRQISGTRLRPPSDATISAIIFWRGLISPCRPRIVTCSSPLSPSVCQEVPSSKQSGNTPMPIRFERWMRSNDWVMTARTPCRLTPLAAQSREEPEPYSLPAKITSGTLSCWYRMAAS